MGREDLIRSKSKGKTDYGQLQFIQETLVINQVQLWHFRGKQGDAAEVS